jgi:hypothetical protein
MNPDEPILGTAAHVDVWLLLEYRPAWKSRAHQENGLSATVRAWVEESLAKLTDAGFKPRLQFIRQPEIDSADTRLFVGVNDQLLAFSGSGYDFLNSLDVLAVVSKPELQTPLAEPLYFVCTNGQRDLCCARFGLRTYAALRERVTERAWQITHLGGHRFAPNVLVFPGGVLYGRVNDSDVDVFSSAVEAGELAGHFLRGRCRYPAHVQAAETAAGRSDLKLLHVEGDIGNATVTFTGGQELVKVSVTRSSESVPVMKSCDAEPEAVFPYFVTGS